MDRMLNADWREVRRLCPQWSKWTARRFCDAVRLMRNHGWESHCMRDTIERYRTPDGDVRVVELLDYVTTTVFFQTHPFA